MAVSLTDTYKTFTGTGSSATYATGIYANAASQIKVYVNEVLQTLGDDYTLNGVGVSTGVDVVATFASGAAVRVQRETDITQLVDTQNNETILEDVLDAAFDKLTMIAQETDASVARAPLFPIGADVIPFGDLDGIADGDALVYEASSGSFVASSTSDYVTTLEGLVDDAEAQVVLAAAEADRAEVAAENAELAVAGASGTGAALHVVIRPDGWTADVYWRGFKDGGTSALDPDGTPKLILTALDLGFDSNGLLTTRRRVIVGTVNLRQPWPNQASPTDSEDATGASRVFALSEPVFAKSDLGFGNSGWRVLATMATGLYTDNGTGGSGSPNPAQAVYCINNSALPYPKMVPNWAISGYLRAAGTFNGEVALDNEYGFDGRPYAAMKLRVTDVNGDTATGPASTTYEASAQVSTTDPNPLVAKASVDVTDLADGLGTIDMLIYPHLGDEVWDSAEEGLTWPTPQVASLPILIDNAGNYTPAYAALDTASGNDGTAVVSTTQATAEASPYQTETALLAAIKTFNNARSHNDHAAGVMLIKADLTGFVTNMNTALTVGATWFTIDCWSSTTPKTIGIKNGTNRRVADRMAFKNLLIYSTSNVDVLDGVTDANTTGLPSLYARFENCKFTASAITNTTPLIYRLGLIDKIGCTMENCGTRDLTRFSVNRQHHRLHIGTVYTTTSTLSIEANIWTAIGCAFERARPFVIYTLVAQPNIQSMDGAIHQNNRWMKMVNSASYAIVEVAVTRGLVIAQSVYELTGPTVPAMAVSYDGTLSPCANIIYRFNTVVGGRTNFLYNDAGTAAVSKEGVRQYCIDYKYNIKDDTFAPENGNRTGNWRVGHAVGCFGNHAVDGSNNGTEYTAGPGSWLGEYLGLAGTAGVAVTYTDDNAAITGDGTGGGNYLPTGTVTTLLNKVAAGRAPYPEDIAGTARLNDGTGSCGAYEVA